MNGSNFDLLFLSECTVDRWLSESHFIPTACFIPFVIACFDL